MKLFNDVIFNHIYSLYEEIGRINIYESMKLFVNGYKRHRKQYTDIETSTLDEDVYWDCKRKKIEPKHTYTLPNNPENPISLISVYDSEFDKFFFFTNRCDFENNTTHNIRLHFKKKTHIKEKEIEYDFYSNLKIFVFDNEEDMLRKYALFHNKTAPYMNTGWYFEDFDIPYIINRLEKLRMFKEKALMSPDGRVWTRMSDGKFSRHSWDNNIDGVNIFDMLWGYQYLFGKHSDGNGLGRTGIRHLGIGKASNEIGKEPWYYNDFKIPDLDSGEEWCIESDEVEESEGFIKFIYYGYLDVLILKLLEEKLSILMSFYFIICFSCGEWSRIHNETTLLDSAALNFKDKNLFLPTKRGRRGAGIEGGLVIQARSGYHYGYTIVLDVSREYPNAIREANLGEDTYIPPEEHHLWEGKDVVRLGNGHWFRKDKVSFLSKMVTFFFALRDKIEEIRDQYEKNSEMYIIWSYIRQKIKDLINTIYGWVANPFSRIYHLPSAESITYLGRSLMRHNKDKQKELSDKLKKKDIIVNGKKTNIRVELTYGDTDSTFTWTNIKNLDMVIKTGYMLEKYLNKTYKEFCEKFNMFSEYTGIAFESVYLNLFFPPITEDSEGAKKKNYVTYKVFGDGQKFDERVFVMMGMSGKKANSPIISSNIQKTYHQMGCMREGKKKILEWLWEMVDFGKKAMSLNEDGEYDMDLLLQCGIPHHFNISPFTYKNNDASVKVARYLLENFDTRIRAGDSILYYYVKRVKDFDLPQTDVFGFDPEKPFFPSSIEIDIEKMLKKTIYMKLIDVLPFMEIDWDEIRNKMIKLTIKDYF